MTGIYRHKRTRKLLRVEPDPLRPDCFTLRMINGNQRVQTSQLVADFARVTVWQLRYLGSLTDTGYR
jgi:hypothetical protein